MDKPTYLFSPLRIESPASALMFFPYDVTMKASNAKAFYRATQGTIPEQTHSLNVGIVENIWERFPDTDALITFQEDLPVGVVTADCVPILIFASDVKGVAAVHAGWKGTLGGIVDNTIETLEKHGAKPENMFVTFGPSISVENYEVDAELAERFIEAGFEDNVSWPNGREAKPHLDLQGVNVARMIRKGIKEENINISDDCTSASKTKEGKPMYPSYRRDGEKASRLFTGIMLMNPEKMKNRII